MKLPLSYEKVRALEIYSGVRRTQKDKEKLIREMTEDELWKSEEASLYGFRSVQIPRSLLYRTQLKAINPAARSVYVWLMTKQRILELAKKAGVENEETDRLPIVTARNCEIANYTGIPASNISGHIKALEDAGLLKTKKVKTGGKITGTLYQLPTWPNDPMGYFYVPIKSMLTPAWISLTHNAKWLWLTLLSDHYSKKGDEGNRFPVYERAYSEIKKHGLKSDATVRKATVELERMGFVYVTHGRYDEDNGQREMNTYQISADHIHLWADQIEIIRDNLRALWNKKPAAE